MLSEQERKELEEELEKDCALIVALGPKILNFAGGNAFIAKDSAIERLSAGRTLITKGLVLVLWQRRRVELKWKEESSLKQRNAG